MNTGVLPKLAGAALLAMALVQARAAEGPEPAAVERLVVEGTNEFRREQGLDALVASAPLQRAAHYFADYMARTDRETGRYYAVQMFGRPRSMRIEFHVTNRTRERVGYRLGERSYSLDPRSTRVHQQCASEELALPAAGAGGRSAARPKDGDRVEVVREWGGLALRGG